MPLQIPRRYLDNAATSWPKPQCVWEAWEQTAREIGAVAGRGGYREALAADAIRTRARSKIAHLLGGVDASRIAFPAGATLALNMAIHGILQPGDHVIATAADHNATLRPLHWLRSRGTIETTIVPCDGAGMVDPDCIARAWRPATKLVVCSHVSNVTGAVQEAAAIGAIAHERAGIFLLDAAQSLGQRPFAVASLNADIVAAPAHKWLLGPCGVGILWVRPGIELDLLVQGGTGLASDSLDMPDSFSDRMEAGTPDVPALAGLCAAVDWLEEHDGVAIGAQCRALAARCAQRLREIPAVCVIAPPPGAALMHLAPIVSFTMEGYDPAELALLLEQMAGAQLRSGFHCAASVHQYLGTLSGGTVRLSFGPFNTSEDIDAVADSLEQLSVSATFGTGQ